MIGKQALRCTSQTKHLSARKLGICGYFPHAVCKGRSLRKNKLSLTRPDQLDIDLGQKFGIEQRAMLGAPRIIDGIASAQIVEPGRREN